MKRTTPSKSSGHKVLELQELDALLALDPAQFDARVGELVIELADRPIRIPTREEWSKPAGIDARVSWTGVYHAEVQGAHRLDRDEEFQMARRYAFLQARARAALAAVGLEGEAVEQALAVTELPRLRGTTRAKQRAGRALHELRELRNRYVEGSLYMVFALAQRYRNLGVDYADLVQEGNASLFQAIDGFDWRRDVRFKTYAQYWIHQAILKLLYNTSRTVRVPIWVQKALRKIKRMQDRIRNVQGREPTSAEIGDALGLPAERVEELLATRRYAVSLDVEMPGGDGATLVQLLGDPDWERDAIAVQAADLAPRLREALGELPSRERLILERRFGLEGREPETLGEIAKDLGVTAERVRQLQNAAIGRLQKPAVKRRLGA